MCLGKFMARSGIKGCGILLIGDIKKLMDDVDETIYRGVLNII